jgi:hypothetical protein
MTTTIKPQAYLVLFNSYFLEISLDDKFSDVVYYRHCGNREDEWTETEIQFDDMNGSAYFTTTHGSEYLLSEFMKY